MVDWRSLPHVSRNLHNLTSLLGSPKLEDAQSTAGSHRILDKRIRRDKASLSRINFRCGLATSLFCRNVQEKGLW